MINLEELIYLECYRQNKNIELIASENVASGYVRQFMSTCLTNKYAEGYPGKRYYGGCQVVDKVENYAIELACKLFGAKYANVQPHSGSQANFAAYRALLPNGGKILSISLDQGGHLTHGSPVNFSGNMFEVCHYELDENGKLNYDVIEYIALKEKPDLIVAGYSAYPYSVDFARFRKIADKVGANLMVDMAHIAGIVAAKLHQSPVPYADIVTSTTHKTLRGPRGGLILTNNKELADKVNKAIFPYSQGGPLMHVIAAKAACFEEALEPSFRRYIKAVLKNTKLAAKEFDRLGAFVSDTDNHLFLLNTLDTYGITGLEAQEKLEKINITVNKNMQPNDTLKPFNTSGLRIGFAAVTTRGCRYRDVKEIVSIIHNYLSNRITDLVAREQVRSIVDRWQYVEDI